jgi:hypothetical protein
MRPIWIVPVIAALAGCGAPSSSSESPEPAAALAPRIVSTQAIDAPLPVYRMVVEPGAPGLTEKARELCGSASHCSVYAWTDAALAGRGFPFTDRERAGLVFQYDVNRSTGFERSLFDCQAFPQPDANQCLSR